MPRAVGAPAGSLHGHVRGEWRGGRALFGAAGGAAAAGGGALGVPGPHRGRRRAAVPGPAPRLAAGTRGALRGRDWQPGSGGGQVRGRVL